MTLFELTFAIAVPFRGMDPDGEKVPVPIPKKKSKKTKIKTQLSDPMLINGYFEVEFPPQYGVHLEYVLVPDEPTFTIDVITWGPVAKVCKYI